MKKLLCIIAAASMVFAVQAEQTTSEPGNIGAGYQGLFPVTGNLINGAVVRGKPAPIGWQGELLKVGGEIDDPGGFGTGEADIIILKGKVYMALIERANSTLYAGASLGWWLGDIDTGGADVDLSGISIAPLAGVEWSFSELPEIGFNFEVSYEIAAIELDQPSGTPDTEIDIDGITVSTGIVYYF